MAAYQLPNRPPRRIRRSRAHTFRISQIPIAECAAFSATHPPRVLSLAAFGRRPLVYVAPLSLAGIRNPYMSAKLSRPFRTASIGGRILLFGPLQSPSFRPDPQYLNALARRAGQGWPPRCPCHARRISRPLLDRSEHDGRLRRVGNALAARRALSSRNRAHAAIRRAPDRYQTPLDFRDSPLCEACSAGPAPMSMARATIASPYIRQLRYGLPLCCMHGRSREKDGAHLHNGRLARPNLRWVSPATHPTRPTLHPKERRNR
jgi:hypothetical protein